MWNLEWNAISARIAGLIDACTFLFQTVEAGENDNSYSTNILIENCNGAAKAILALRRYGTALPSEATTAIQRFKDWWLNTFVDEWISKSGGLPAVQASVVMLASVRAELDHVLADQDQIIRNHVTRGFTHLQRTLVVDEEVRLKWLTAFDQGGELACEALGAVHLLTHGIWAFKTSATGERTDLIRGTHLVVNEMVVESAQGLVLTEWKLVTKDSASDVQARAAKRQAGRYPGRTPSLLAKIWWSRDFLSSATIRESFRSAALGASPKLLSP